MNVVDVCVAGRLFPFSLLCGVPGHLQPLQVVEAGVQEKWGPQYPQKFDPEKMSKTNYTPEN